AHGAAEAGDLGEAAGEQGALGVEAGLEAVEDARGDGDDVLHGAGEFDAEQVRVGVHAQPACGEGPLDIGGEGRVVAGGDHGGGEAAGEFGGDGGAAEGGEAPGAGVGVVREGVG